MFVTLLKMNDFFIKQYLLFMSKTKKPFDLTVEGTSMLPILQPGEIINICAKDNYSVGDILVFFYKNELLIVHRLLKIEDGRYFCKGDNSFRLEDIEKQDIVGAVMIESDINNTSEFINASYSVNRIFRESGYDINITKSSRKYAEYANKYLGESK